jgi:hypothetical protein
MWDKINPEILHYDSAVLSFVDGAGYPISARCRPQADPQERVLRLDLPGSFEVIPGPACLLYHQHDEKMTKQRACLVRGQLERDSIGWYLRPERFVPGEGVGTFAGLRFLRDGRRKAKAYLEARGWERPKVNWQEIMLALGEVDIIDLEDF